MAAQAISEDMRGLTLNGRSPLRMTRSHSPLGHDHGQSAWRGNGQYQSSGHCHGNLDHSHNSDQRYSLSGPQHSQPRDSSPMDPSCSDVSRPRNMLSARDNLAISDWVQKSISAGNSPNDPSPHNDPPGIHTKIPETIDNHSSDRNSPNMYSSSESWSLAQDFLSSGSGSVPHKIHHRRSRSHKARYYTGSKKYIEVDDWELGDERPRVASMPCRGAFTKHVSYVLHVMWLVIIIYKYNQNWSDIYIFIPSYSIIYITWCEWFFFCINFIYLTRITHALKALGVLHKMRMMLDQK